MTADQALQLAQIQSDLDTARSTQADRLLLYRAVQQDTRDALSAFQAARIVTHRHERRRQRFLDKVGK
jgi:hypothetical protein